MSWKETRRPGQRLAAGLVALGVEPQQRVAIAATTRIEWILADLAIMCAGAATTTVYPSTNADDVAYILGDSECRVVFAEDAEQVEKLPRAAPSCRTSSKVVLFDGTDATATGSITSRRARALGERAWLERARRRRQPDRGDRAGGPGHADLHLRHHRPAQGRPAGPRRLDLRGRRRRRRRASSGADDLQYLWLPMSHSFGKVLLRTQLAFGFTTAVDGRVDKIVDNLGRHQADVHGRRAADLREGARPERHDARRRRAALKEKIFDWAFGVGLEGRRLAARRASRSPLLAQAAARRLRQAGASARSGTASAAGSGSSSPARPRSTATSPSGSTRPGCLILEGYGLTETSRRLAASTCPATTGSARVGPPLPGHRGPDRRGRRDPASRGRGVMRGYHNNPEATAEVLTQDGWFHTGDIGELDDDGYLRITDRKKDLIKTSGGKYVAPQKIEVMFKADCPCASQIVVHGEGRKFVSALITLDPEAIAEWADEHGLAGKPYAEIVKAAGGPRDDPGARRQLNGRLERWETIKKVRHPRPRPDPRTAR